MLEPKVPLVRNLSCYYSRITREAWMPARLLRRPARSWTPRQTSRIIENLRRRPKKSTSLISKVGLLWSKLLYESVLPPHSITHWYTRCIALYNSRKLSSSQSPNIILNFWGTKLLRIQFILQYVLSFPFHFAIKLILFLCASFLFFCCFPLSIASLLWTGCPLLDRFYLNGQSQSKLNYS